MARSSEVAVGIPGDICAVAKIDEIHRDVMLHESHDEDESYPAPHFPTPLFGLAVRAATRGDEQKLSDTLHKLLEEDPVWRRLQRPYQGNRAAWSERSASASDPEKDAANATTFRLLRYSKFRN